MTDDLQAVKNRLSEAIEFGSQHGLSHQSVAVADVSLILAALAESRGENENAEKVVAAAKAEVLARGYRSSDMARALKAHSGEYWFEAFAPEGPPPTPTCGYAVTTEMDDGPLTQTCVLAPHDIDTPHHFGRLEAPHEST